jgi:hypothetical protein
MDRRLTLNQYQPLNWKLFPDMIRVNTEGDGSCFFHAILNSCYTPYITGIAGNGVSLDRKQCVRNFRRDLSYKLGDYVEGDPNNKIWYDNISRGKLRKLSKTLPHLSLENMKATLDSNSPVDHIYNEFISNIIKKDIYLLDFLKQDVYITGDDEDILYKDRQSIVILVIPGHYELVGVMRVNKQGLLVIQTKFEHDDEFIRRIRERMKSVIKK